MKKFTVKNFHPFPIEKDKAREEILAGPPLGVWAINVKLLGTLGSPEVSTTNLFFYQKVKLIIIINKY